MYVNNPYPVNCLYMSGWPLQYVCQLCLADTNPCNTPVRSNKLCCTSADNAARLLMRVYKASTFLSAEA